eukprot:1022375-Pleurochrysis_carterae.AAC.2
MEHRGHNTQEVVNLVKRVALQTCTVVPTSSTVLPLSLVWRHSQKSPITTKLIVAAKRYLRSSKCTSLQLCYYLPLGHHGLDVGHLLQSHLVDVGTENRSPEELFDCESPLLALAALRVVRVVGTRPKAKVTFRLWPAVCLIDWELALSVFNPYILID